MYLRALEIQGFKSFPDKTRLTFEKDITAIVGPNGSGKSNISDAILWVMGEQRTKALRGSKMEDVIFGGTEKRGKLGYAQVSLIIDNSARIFDSDSGEVMLTRRYYRSGESEYFINRESVRLKDINSLLMDTGLGRDGYSIIGQGRIAEIVSTKSTDRREVFEEAAGISRFRYRKEEAERKLERTEENLLRINDKIEELEMQVGPLKEQSETARRYLVLRDELKGREVSVWMATLEKLHAQSESVNLEYEQVTKNLENARASLEALYASSGSITERMHQKDVETEQARERLSAQESAASACESAAAVIRANVQNTRESSARLMEDMQRQESRARELRDQIEENEGRIAAIDAELKTAEEREKQTGNVIDGCRLSGADIFVYRHGDMDDLDRKLSLCREHRRRLVVSDGVFSMDGDILDLPRFLAVTRRHDAFSLVDEAHATGVVGPTGRGLAELFGCDRPDITVGTLSKALGSEGGFVCGARVLIDYLRNLSRPFIFSTAPGAPAMAAALAALEILKAEPGRVARLRANVALFVSELARHGIRARGETPIVPVVVGDEQAALDASAALEARGFLVPAIRYPTVARGAARLRIAIMSAHEPAQLRAAAAALAELLPR